METDSEFPIIEGVNVIKVLYKTKLSTIWLGKSLTSSEYVIVKGKLRSEISNGDFEFLKRERAFLESNKIINEEEQTYPNFPRFIKAWKDDQSLYLILNFIEGAPISSLNSGINCVFNFNNFENFSDFKIKKNVFLKILSQIINHLKTLHRNNYIYRDLKLNNLLINKKLEISLIDFGFVKRLYDDERTSTICGTYHAFAPEMFQTKFGIVTGYDRRSDIWSLGVLIYELLCVFAFFCAMLRVPVQFFAGLRQKPAPGPPVSHKT